MSTDPRFGGRLAGLAIAVMVGVTVLAASLPPGAADAVEPCCFANDRYQGVCTVIPGEGETCQTVLDYLNNPMSAGKTYCGGTKVRGGWVLVDCATGKPPARQGASESTPRGQGPAPAGADDPKS